MSIFNADNAIWLLLFLLPYRLCLCDVEYLHSVVARFTFRVSIQLGFIVCLLVGCLLYFIGADRTCSNKVHFFGFIFFFSGERERERERAKRSLRVHKSYGFYSQMHAGAAIENGIIIFSLDFCVVVDLLWLDGTCRKTCSTRFSLLFLFFCLALWFCIHIESMVYHNFVIRSILCCSRRRVSV